MMCPRQTAASCGIIEAFNGNDIYAETTKKTFEFSGLRYDTENDGSASYSVCSYQIMNPPGGYDGGKIYVTFPKVEQGVSLYVSGDGGEMQVGSTTSKGTKFVIENGKSLRISAVPAQNSVNTAFSFEYYTDGVKNSGSPIFQKIA